MPDGWWVPGCEGGDRQALPARTRPTAAAGLGREGGPPLSEKGERTAGGVGGESRYTGGDGPCRRRRVDGYKFIGQNFGAMAHRGIDAHASVSRAALFFRPTSSEVRSAGVYGVDARARGFVDAEDSFLWMMEEGQCEPRLQGERRSRGWKHILLPWF